MSKMTAALVTTLLDEAVDILDNEADCPDSDSGPVLRYVRDMLREVREHLIETDEQRRERFERWFVESVSGGVPNEFARTLMSDEYNDGEVNVAWLSFNAAIDWRGETKGGG